MANIKELSQREDMLTGGHRLCAGCGASVAVRQVMLGAGGKPLVVGCATGCLEVSTTIYPYTAWKSSYIHNAFENTAATVSGVETAYRALRKRGAVEEDFRFVAFGGDGGTYDIGLQSLSGVLERGHRMVYVCYDNGAYMNTGIQRSGATPYGSWSSTTPIGSESFGKPQFRKDLTAIVAAHNVPYVAQASVADWKDLTAKAEKAFAADGPAFLNIMAPCPRGWRYPSEMTIQLARLAWQTCYWPLFEVDNGVWRVTRKPREKLPVVEWLKPQGRFVHLFRPENAHVLEEFQRHVDLEWDRLQGKCAPVQPAAAS